MRLLSVIAAAGAVCACATGGAPAPVDFRGSAAPSASPTAPARSGPAPIEHRSAPTAAPSPAPAEPIWEGEGAPLSTWALQPEDAQPYDPRNPDAAHVVAPGETLYTIAARRQTPLRALIDANGLTAPFRLEAGQVLILPPPAVHTVQAGDTLAAIGRRYNVDLRSLALLNRLTAPYALRPGDRLVLPTGARGVEPVAAPIAAASSGPRPPGRLAWPVTGAVLSAFGAQGPGGGAQSIDIAASPGAPVRAAADGRVLFSGEGPSALGGLVILDHGGGLVTTVGFVTGFRVNEGQRVAQGETLALASANRVLFQVRENGAAIDPAALLSQP